MKIVIKIFILILFFNNSIFTQETNLKKGDLKEVSELINKGNYDKAVVILKKISLERKNTEDVVDIKTLLGIAFLGKKDYKKAEACMQEVLDKKPDLIIPNYILALIYEFKKEYEKSLIFWKKVYQLSEEERFKEMVEKHIHQLKILLKE